MLQFLLPFLPGLLGSGATALGATGLGATLSGMGTAMGGLGALGGLLGGAKQAMTPPMVDMARSAGMLGQVQDATGGLLTDAYASRNIGGGLLGSMARPAQHGKAFGNMMDMMTQGAMMGMMGQEKEPMPQAPTSRYTSNYQPISRRDPDEELRKRRLAYLTRRY